MHRGLFARVRPVHRRRRPSAIAVASVAVALGLSTAGTVVVPTNAAGAAEAAKTGARQQTGNRPTVSLVRVETPTRADKERLRTLGLDVTRNAAANYIDVLLRGREDRQTLRRAGFDYDVRVADLTRRSDAQRDKEQQRLRTLAQSDLPSGRVSYRTLSGINNELRYLARSHPGLVERFALPHRSLRGAKVWALEITHDPDTRTGKPVFLMTGAHHAREWPSAESTMEFARELIQGNGTNPRITSLLRRARVIVVPVVNPDGFDISRSRQIEYKRKNCRLETGQRPAPGECSDWDNRDLGVDLNRNYGGNWGGAGSSPDPTSGTYFGAAPFSEPEVQNIRHLVSNYQVTVLITNHTYGDLILYPPGQESAPDSPDEEVYDALGDAMSASNGYTSQQSHNLYDTSGTTEDWSYFATGGFGFTFEIGTEGFHPDYETAVIDEYLGTRENPGGNRGAYLTAMEAAVDPAKHAVISGTAPAGAVLTVRKDFTMYTAPVQQPGGGTGSILPYPVHLSSSITAVDGEFDWHVNPSLRPSSNGDAFIKESWKLTCATADGTVLQRIKVTVARGERAEVDLGACQERWAAAS